MMKKMILKMVFLIGLLVFVLFVIMLWVFGFIIGMMDQMLFLLFELWQFEWMFGFYLLGIGVVLMFVFIFVVGLVMQNFIGQKFVMWWNVVVCYILVVGLIYMSVKQVFDMLLLSSGNVFCKVLLIEYLCCGLYMIVFLIGMFGGDVVNYLMEEYVSVYVFMMLNLMLGFFLMLLKSEVIEFDMLVDVVFKYIVLMGVVVFLVLVLVFVCCFVELLL